MIRLLLALLLMFATVFCGTPAKAHDEEKVYSVEISDICAVETILEAIHPVDEAPVPSPKTPITYQPGFGFAVDNQGFGPAIAFKFQRRSFELVASASYVRQLTVNTIEEVIGLPPFFHTTIVTTTSPVYDRHVVGTFFLYWNPSYK